MDWSPWIAAILRAERSGLENPWDKRGRALAPLMEGGHIDPDCVRQAVWMIDFVISYANLRADKLEDDMVDHLEDGFAVLEEAVLIDPLFEPDEALKARYPPGSPS